MPLGENIFGTTTLGDVQKTLTEVLTTTATSLASVLDVQTFKEAITTVMTSEASETDKQTFYETILSTIQSSSSVSDISAFAENLLTIITSDISVEDMIGETEILRTTAQVEATVTSPMVYYKKGILNEVDFSQQLKDIYWGRVDPSDLTLEISDADGTFSALITAGEEFRNRGMKFRIYEPLETPQVKFLVYGKVIDYSLSPGKISFTLALQNLEEQDAQIPKKLYETTDWTETPTNIINPAQDLGKPYNIVFGHAKKVPLICVHSNYTSDYYDFIIGYGTIHSNHNNKATTVNIYRNKVLVPSNEYYIHGGEATIQYTGSSFGLTAGNPNPYYLTINGQPVYFAFIRFLKEQIDFSGNNPYELTADLWGLKLSGSTVERNFIRCIQYLLSNTAWGLGLTVETAYFDAVAPLMADRYCDGFIGGSQFNAMDIIEELLFACQGRLFYTADGKIGIDVEVYDPKVKGLFGWKDGKEENIISIDEYRKTAVREAIKAFALQYGYNAWEGSYIYQNRRSVMDFGEEQVMESRFIRDHTTADKITCFHKNRMTYGDTRLSITVGMDGRTHEIGDIPKIVIPDWSINSAFNIRKLSRTANTFKWDLTSYDAAMFTYIVGDIPDDSNADDLPDFSNTAPTAPTSLQKTGSGTDQASDGSTIAYFNVSAIAALATNKVTLVKFGYKKTGESFYTYVDGTQSGTNWYAKINGLIPGLYYDLIAVAYNAFDLPSISNPTLTSQLAPGDTTAPAQPTGLSATQGIGKITLSWTANTEKDLNHYDIYRGGIKIFETRDTKYPDTNLSYGVSYTYYIKAVDNTGNPSPASSSVAQSPRQTTTPDIGDGAVETPKIKDQAVTIPVDAYTAGRVDISSGYWVTVQQCSITSTGAPIHITACLNVWNTTANPSGITAQILRGSTPVYIVYNAFDIAAGHQDSMSFAVRDTPGAGSFTYYLQVYAVTTMAVFNRSILLLEAKK